MARLLLLQVKNNQVAEQLVKDMWRLQEATHIDNSELAELGTLVLAYGNVRWMIAQPLSACKCRAPQKKQDKSKDGWAKTKRFGWWIHKRCNKPSAIVVRNFVKNLLNGNNDLLDELRATNEADIHIMPSNEHIMAGPPKREEHTMDVLNLPELPEQPAQVNERETTP